MSYPVGYPLRDRIEVELVEADVEMGFRLVDLAEAAAAVGDRDFAAHAIESADAVCLDIEQRLAQMRKVLRNPFLPLVDELHREIDSARPRP